MAVIPKSITKVSKGNHSWWFCMREQLVGFNSPTFSVYILHWPKLPVKLMRSWPLKKHDRKISMPPAQLSKVPDTVSSCDLQFVEIRPKFMTAPAITIHNIIVLLSHHLKMQSLHF